MISHIFTFQNNVLFLAGKLLAEPGNFFAKTHYVVTEATLFEALAASRKAQGLPAVKYNNRGQSSDYPFAHNKDAFVLADILLADVMFPANGELHVTVEEESLLWGMQRSRAIQQLPMLGIEEEGPAATGGCLPEISADCYGPDSKPIPTSEI